MPGAVKNVASGDTLVVTKPSRFARPTFEELMIVRQLFEQGVKVIKYGIY
ncbi:recombinase family protein [Bacillus sp. ISL-45]